MLQPKKNNSNNGLSEEDNKTLIQELTKYANEGASDDDLRVFRETFINAKKKSTSNQEKSNGSSVTRKSDLETKSSSSATQKYKLPQQDAIPEEKLNASDLYGAPQDNSNSNYKTKTTYINPATGKASKGPVKDFLDINRQRKKDLSNSFIESTKIDENELNDINNRLKLEENNGGFFGGIKQGLIESTNKAIDFLGLPNSFSNSLKIEDRKPFSDEVEEVKKEAFKNKQTLSDTEVMLKAKQLFVDKQKENIFIDKANSFIDNLDQNDKKILELDRYDKINFLNDENKKRLKSQAALKIKLENDSGLFEDLKKQINDYNSRNINIPDELLQNAEGLKNSILSTISTIDKNYQKIADNKSDLSTAEKEFDLFKRENRDWVNIGKNIGIGVADIGIGLLDFANYISNNIGPVNINGSDARNIDYYNATKSFRDNLEREKEKLRKPVESIESLEGFINYSSDLVSSQLPILLATATGEGGLALIGASSTGQKYAQMNEEVVKGEATYSPYEMAIAPAIYGGAEVISELPTLSILKKAGRVLSAAEKTSPELLAKSVKDKAIEMAKDYGIDMSKEMAGEQFTNFAQNFNDKYVLNKKDVGLWDNTGKVFKDTFTLTSILKVSPHIGGALLKPFQNKNELMQVDENSKKIIEFSKQLSLDNISDAEKSVLKSQINKLTEQSSKIMANTISNIDSMSEELFNEVLFLNKKAGELKLQAQDIEINSKLKNKKELISSLEQEYNEVQNRRKDILEGRTSIVEVLPLQEQEKLKRQAMEDLVTELNPDGSKDITITDKQVVDRANEIYLQSKSNDNQIKNSNENAVSKENANEIPNSNQIKDEGKINGNTAADGGVRVGDNVVEKNRTSEQQNTSPESVQSTNDGGNIEGKSKIDFQERDEFDNLLSGEAEQRRKDGRYTRDGIEYVRQEPIKTPKGKISTVKFADGVEVEAEYTLMESKDVQPSHLNGRRNPNFFITEAQPKNRKDSSSIEASDKIGKNPKLNEVGENSLAYSGAPVVNERGEVIQGNNRAEGLKKHYANKGVSYKEQLKAEADKFGISPGDVDAMENPILVRKVAVNDVKAIELGNYDVKDIETGGTRRIDPVATSRRIPNKVKGELMDILFKDNSDQTLNAAIRQKIEPIINILKRFLNPAQIEGIIGKDGEPKIKGLEDLQTLIQHFLFDNGNVNLPEHFESLSAKARNGILKALPKLFSLNSEKSIISELQNAIGAYHSFINSGNENFKEWTKQADMFNEGKTPSENYTELELEIADILLNTKTEKEIKTIFDTYHELVTGTDADMFNEAIEGLNKYEAVKKQFNIDYNERKSKSENEVDNTSESTKNSEPGNGRKNSEQQPKQPKSQKERVKEAIGDNAKSIKDIAEQTGILEPNVRRILGVGAKEGTFERVDKGIYILKTSDGKQTAWIEAGDAVESLERMASEGKKFDMVFLDPAYFSRALIGGNRGIKQYDFIMPEQFAKVMQSVSTMVDDDNHVYVMLSGAATAQKDMQKYVDGVVDAGFKVVGEGGYQKTFKDGSPVTNVRGEVAQPERLLLVTKSGNARQGEIPVNLNFRFIRPSIKNSYQTEKPKELLRSLIQQSTLEGEDILDPFAGSGVTGEQAIETGRNVTLIEKNPDVVDNIIKPRIESIVDAKEKVSKIETPKKIDKNSSASDILDWLNNAEKRLDDFGKENLSMGLPVVIAKLAVKAMKEAVKAGLTTAQIIEAGLEAIRNSDWFKNLTGPEQQNFENDFEQNFFSSIDEIPIGNDRQTENIINRSLSESISELDAYKEVSDTFDKAEKELENKKASKDILRNVYRKFVKRFTDRQYTAKRLLDNSGLYKSKNLIINSHGSSGYAKMNFEDAYKNIYSSLNRKDRRLLDRIIQAKRFIAIDENRTKRGLEPVSHPNFIDGIRSQKYLDALRKEIGEDKFLDLENRASFYFKEYKNLLEAMLKNGLISQKVYDSLNNIDYQPRVFLQFVTDFNGDMDTASKKNNINNGGLSADQIKTMKEGDAHSLVTNSEWLLMNSMAARYKSMAMNNINKKFVLEEFPKALQRFEDIDPSKFKNNEEKRFYTYFKELKSKVILNPIIEFTPSGNPVYFYTKTPINFKKAYYYEDGQRNEFFLENELHDSWHDNLEGFISPNAKEFISYASGSALLKGIATGNNPAFPIVNTPRDFLFTISFSDQYSNIVPKAILQLGKDVVKAIKELRKKDSNIVEKYFEYGGAMDFLSTQGKLKKDTILGQALENAVDPKNRDVIKNIFNVLSLHKISKYSELMFRIGIFQRSIHNQLKDLGYKDISEVTDNLQLEDIYNQAVANARGILDFNQGGYITKDLESIMPYINVAFQGGKVAASSFEKDPVGVSSRILQVATLASSIPVGISLVLIGINKEDDDNEKSVYDIYLDAMNGVSKYQKSKYMNIVTGSKNEEGQYKVIKIAKAQELSPFMSITDDIYQNFIRSMAGKEKKSAKHIASDALFTFNSNVMPFDFTSPSGFFTRTPVSKAVLTYATGYDFFREQPLSMDIGKVPKSVEGINMSSTEEFYKKLGVDYGLSPVRSKAFVESFITSPNTNPFIGVLYGGADAISSDKDMKAIGKKFAEDLYKSTGRRIVSYTSDFNRKLELNEALQEKIDEIKKRDYIQKQEFKKISKEYINNEISKDELRSKLQELEPNERKRFINKIKDTKKLNNIDGTILDIKYEQNTEAKATMLLYYYGNIYDKENRDIYIQIKRAGGILTPGVKAEYAKLLKTNENIKPLK